MNNITYFHHEGRDVPLAEPSDSNDNTYTVIVGKNGVGKSRLLASMVNEFSALHRYQDNYFLDTTYNDRNSSMVIAVSTSPFDKFKLPPRNQNNTHTNYRYVGMRSGSSYSLSSISLISSATCGILERYLNNENYDRLIDVFDTLGFTPKVQLIFKPNFKTKRYVRSEKEGYDSKGYLIHPKLEWLTELGIEVPSRVAESLIDLPHEERNHVMRSFDILHDVFEHEKAISISLDFSHGEIFSLNNEIFDNKSILESLNILLKLNVVRLMDFKLTKYEFGVMSLRRASSGEQCMLVIMLGIAGHINDNSLIFIDEPEISLHPKWQEDFMILLIKTFNKYSNCQFFIATHSPQIISRMSDKNCYVTSLSKNEIYPPSFFRNRSSDFQLAELFDAPGFRNEYISRLVFGLISKVRRNKSVDLDDRAKLEKLLNMNKMIDEEDPTYELILSVKEVIDYYASN